MALGEWPIQGPRTSISLSFPLFLCLSLLRVPPSRHDFSPKKNIAATSVTIDGVRYVVDSGFVKQKMYDSTSGIDSLLVVPISKSAAAQR